MNNDINVNQTQNQHHAGNNGPNKHLIWIIAALSIGVLALIGLDVSGIVEIIPF